MKRYAFFAADCRGAIAVMFAISLLAIAFGVGAAVDMSRLADARANLQRAVDNAALSGAAAYSAYSTSSPTAFQTKAMTIATSAFCDLTNPMPAGFSVVATTASNGATAETCDTAAGPDVSAVIGGYTIGTDATAAGVAGYGGCSSVNAVVNGVVCGFAVTVTASATMSSLFPALFGASKTIQVVGIALNPFINLGNAIKTKIEGSAYNANSVWVYPVLVDANGNPDFTTNPGALPGSGCSASAPTCSDANPSGCDDSPLTFVCGDYVMIEATNYANCTSACVPANGSPSGTTFLNGAVVNPPAPPAVVTATTPIGFAFQTIAGGSTSYGSPYTTLSNNCIYPQGATYNGTSQVYSNVIGSNQSGGNPVGSTGQGVSPTPTAGLDWRLVTHWFFSSYLANGLPPSYGELLSQTSSSTNLTFNATGLGTSSNTFSPSAQTCASSTKSVLTSYPPGTTQNAGTSYDNLSLFIIGPQPVGTAYQTACSTGYGLCSYSPGTSYGNSYAYTPTGTPGYQYAALSCQAYGTSQYTFYWNDMGGSAGYGDDRNYENGSAIVTCTGPSFVVLIG